MEQLAELAFHYQLTAPSGLAGPAGGQRVALACPPPSGGPGAAGDAAGRGAGCQAQVRPREESAAVALAAAAPAPAGNAVPAWALSFSRPARLPRPPAGAERELRPPG